MKNRDSGTGIRPYGRPQGRDSGFGGGAIAIALTFLSAANVSCKWFQGEGDKPPAAVKPVVVMETSLGTIKIELDPVKAPKTTANFLQYVDDGFYDGTIFHRVIANFMIQGGGFTPDMKEKATRPTIANEAGNGLKNVRGTIAMARTPEVDSAAAQFFISVEDNANLDHVDNTQRGFGYAVFGKVVEGMDVVDKIRMVRTRTVTPNEFENVPVEPVVIKSVKKQ